MDIILQTQDRDAFLAFRTLQPYSNHSGFAAKVSVRAGAFAGEAIVSTRPDRFQRFLRDLAVMDGSLQGTARFESDYEDHFVELAVATTGAVVVSGALYHYAELPQELRFTFRTDQTCLGPLLRDLQAFSRVVAT